MYLENVNQLQRDSFFSRDLYDELMAIESDLDRQVMAGQLRSKAKEYGIVKTFDDTRNAAEREMSKYLKQEISGTSKVMGECKTNFSLRDQDGQLNCGEWVADDEGVRVHTDKGLMIVCPHPIFISRILRNAETGKYKVELIYSVRSKIKHIFVGREVIASTTKIIKLAEDGVQVTNLTAPMLVQYLSDLESLNPDLIKEEISTSKLGWIDGVDRDGTSIKQFLPHMANIVFDNETNYRSLVDSIKSYGDPQKWYSLVKDIRAKRQPEVLINLAASFASVLVEPCGTLPFIVSLWGGTGIGKSVILKLCTSVWADPSEGRYIADPKATYTAMEMRLDVLNNLPLTIDDMAQVTAQYDGDFSELIYKWCSGKGRERSNKELGLNKLTSWRNCTITNGERSLVDETAQGGAINRVIDIESNGSVLFDGKAGNKTVKVVESSYGHAGEDFIMVINNIGYENLPAIYTEWYDKLKEESQRLGVEKEDKQLAPMALILTADYLIEKYLFCDDVRIDIETALSYLRNKGESSEERNAYEYLIEMCVAYSSRFNEDGEDARELWGFFRDGYVYIIGTIFNKIMKDGGFQGKSFLSWAKHQNLVACDGCGNPKKVVKFAGQAIRMVVIKMPTDTEESQQNQGFDELEANLPFV